MTGFPEGIAIVYCEGAFGTTNGKTAHGLVRRSVRYKVAAVMDSGLAGRDAGQVLDGRVVGIPVCKNLQSAIEACRSSSGEPTHFIIGLAPDGGRLSKQARADVVAAIEHGLSVVAGLHDFLSEDQELASLAARHGVYIWDVRKPPTRDKMHFFSGKIEEVDSFKVALLGTDSAVGKRTTAWMLVDVLNQAGVSCELIGTGQTAWLQGARYGIVLDSLINDFISGEIEHVVWTAWDRERPEVIVLEGQGSLLNPAYPGGFELLAAGRPDVVVLQHAPVRREYDGFPGYPLHPLRWQIQAIEVVSDKPVIAVTVNHEKMRMEQVPAVCKAITREAGLPAYDVLTEGAEGLAETIRSFIRRQS